MRGIDELDKTLEAGVQRVREAWAWIIVLALAVFMFATRMRTFSRFNREDQVNFFGTDPYYHAREILYSVHNFPRTLGYDPWTQYPLGTDPGQFGTLFDQIGAALAWIVGIFVDGGQPTLDTVLDVATAYPALLGALTLIPIFLLARDLFGEEPAVFVAVAASLIPGTFLVRSLASVVDHHIMEALLSTLAVWASYRALRAFEEADPTLDDLLADPRILWTEHRPALAVSLFAALAFWAYLAAWPPGVLFIGIVGAWLAIETVLEIARESDPGPVVATGATLFTFLAVLMLPYALTSRRGGFSALDFTWMQPVVALLFALGLVVLASLGRTWRDRELPSWGYPPASVGLGLVTLGMLYLVLPSLVHNVLNGASWVLDSTMGWFPGIGVERTRLTIAEAQPAEWAGMFDDFGFLFYTAIAGWVLALIDLVRGTDREDALLSVWAFVAISGALTQARFMYYLAVAVLILNGKFAAKLFEAARLMAEDTDQGKGGGTQDRISPRTGKIVVTVLLALALLPVNVLGFSSGECRGDLNAWALAGCFGPDEEVKGWANELDWLRTNTPRGPLSLTSTPEAPERGQRYDYPPGAYGVLSWWDYGHQIEFDGRRAPIANPFQQQAPLASEIFTANNETSALALLDDYLGDGNQARYLMIDDAMVTGKFSAIVVWADEADTYRSGGADRFVVGSGENQSRVRLPTVGDEVRSMFLQHVYHEDGSGYEHFRLVRENPTYAWIGNRVRITQEGQLRFLDYNGVLRLGSAQQMRSGFGSLTYDTGDRALSVNENTLIYDAEVESTLKTYERVAGARLTGTTEPGATVTASVPLIVEPTQRTFTYTMETIADADGTYQVTVPYSTTQPVPIADGGTRSGVTAQEAYTLTAGNRSVDVDVPDAAVLEGRAITVPALN